jgi:ABC-type sugar transport system ATPase subunit
LNGGPLAATVRPRAPLAATAGVLGIRARHVEWQPLAGTAEEPWLQGTVAEVDNTGDDTLIYANVGAEPVRILETRGRTAAVGDAIAIRFPEQAIHLFAGDRRVDIEAAPPS